MNRIGVTACVAVGTIGVLSAALGGVQARESKAARAGTEERDLVVTLVTPTNNQEVLGRLDDPGLNGVITVRFSSSLNPRDIIDDQNVVNRLSSKVEMLDSSFQRVPGTPSVRRNILTFSPLSIAIPDLAQGQYTLNLKSSIRNTRGRLLNNGLRDFTTTFTVGTDVYSPVLRKITPINGQTGIGLNERIIATFNEPIDFPSALTSIAVQDASTNPPTAIPGAGGGTGITVERGGFDVAFTPDPCFGYPPKTPIQFIIQGVGYNFATVPPTALNINTLTDVLQNKFKRDNGLQWTADPVIQYQYNSPNGIYADNSGQFKMQFQTKGVKPPPQALRPGGSMMRFAMPPGSPCFWPLFQSPSCWIAGQMELFTTATGLGEMDLRAYITRFNQGITDFSLITVVPNTPVRLGRPAGVTLDPRVIAPGNGANSLHTFVYVVDQRTATVLIVRSDNFKVIGRFTGFSSPRDVSVSTNFNQTATSLYVSDFAANQLVALDLESIRVSFTGQPGAPSPCEAIKDHQNNRAFISVGKGPTNVSADCWLQQRVMCTNTLESSASIVDVSKNKLIKSYTTGSNPVSCDWLLIGAGAIRVALIANQGGLNDPNGSASFYIQAPPFNNGIYINGLTTSHDGIESTFTDGVQNPTDIGATAGFTDGQGYTIQQSWFLSNTGGHTVMSLGIQVVGSVFGLDISPLLLTTVDVGPNPTSSVWDGYYPNGRLFSSVIGTGSMAAVDPLRSVPAVQVPAPGMRHLWNVYSQ